MTESRGDFSRQSFLGDDSEAVLAGLRVAVIGGGGGGSHIAQQLAHIGVGHIRLIDPQEIEDSNLNRLVTATQEDVDKKRLKVEILARYIKSVRPWIEVVAEPHEWENVDHLIKDVHVIFGCVDGYRRRRDLERAARRFLIPYIDIGMDVKRLADRHYAVAGQMILSLPGEPCMICMGFLTEERLAEEARRYGDVGINPQVVWTNGMLGSLAIGAFMQMVTPWSDYRPSYVWLELEGNRQTVRPSPIPEHTIRGPCKHFESPDDIGDPFFKLKKTT